MSQVDSPRQVQRYDVFISHSKLDKPVADAVVHSLESNGLRCWIAPRDISPGKSWSEAIIDGLDQSRVFVLMYSSNANESQHVLREVERAISKNKIVIPFRLEDVPPSRGLEYCISLPHWLDALTPPLQQHIDRLVETVSVNVQVIAKPGVDSERTVSDFANAFPLQRSQSMEMSQQPSSQGKADDTATLPIPDLLPVEATLTFGMHSHSRKPMLASVVCALLFIVMAGFIWKLPMPLARFPNAERQLKDPGKSKEISSPIRMEAGAVESSSTDHSKNLNSDEVLKASSEDSTGEKNANSNHLPNLTTNFSGNINVQAPAREARRMQEAFASEIGKNIVEDNGIGMKLVLIPPGEFWAKRHISDDSGLLHQVKISKPFYIGQTEVTQSQWRAVMKNDPWKNQSYAKEGEDYPAVGVTWYDANDYCQKLSALEGRQYLLPTEAQWEYACRSGTNTEWSFGDSIEELHKYAWYDENAMNVGEEYPHRVRQKAPNSFGLYDMHGNISEWCRDVFDPSAYSKRPSEPMIDPIFAVPNSEVTLFKDYRPTRGGDWLMDAKYTLSGHRHGDSPKSTECRIGFRVIRIEE